MTVLQAEQALSNRSGPQIVAQHLRPPLLQDTLDTADPGYQEPLPESEVRPLQEGEEDGLELELEGGRGDGGHGEGAGAPGRDRRGRGRGRGRCVLLHCRKQDGGGGWGMRGCSIDWAAWSMQV